MSELWDEEKKFWIDQTEGRAVLSHGLVFAFCLRSWTWRVLFRLVIIGTCWICASMQQNNPNSYIYWIFLLTLNWSACESHIKAQVIKSKVSSQTPCCWGYYSEECGLKDKIPKLWHKLEQISQWKVRRVRHRKLKAEGRIGCWKVWFLADGFTSRQSKWAKPHRARERR